MDYQAPALIDLGSVEELTLADGCKTGGTFDGSFLDTEDNPLTNCS